MIPRRGVGFVIGLLAIVGAACGDDGGEQALGGPSGDDGLRVASFDFDESVLLAELYAQSAESIGAPVIRLGTVGPREIVMPALELGLVDLVPEYLGTALRRLGIQDPSVDTTTARAHLVDRLDPLGLTALAPAPAEDKNVVVVTAANAESLGLESISDLAPLAPELRFGGPPECPDRPLCLIGLERVYDLRFAEFVAQRSLRFTVEALRRGEIDVGLMFSTDPALAASNLTVLADDRRLQPAENIVPVVRSDALARWGTDLVVALDAVSAELTTDELQDLNLKVADGGPVDRVVGDWLRARGLG